MSSHEDGWPSEWHVIPRWVGPVILAGLFALGSALAFLVDWIERRRRGAL